MNRYQAVHWASSILALAQVACATTGQGGPNPKVAFAVAAVPVCRVAAAPVAVSGKPYLKPYLGDGVIAIAENNRLEAVFTSRGAYGSQCVAVDLTTMGPRSPLSEAERAACGRLGKVESPVSMTSEGETMLVWDTTRDDRSDLFVGVLVFDLPARGAPGRPHARVSAHAFALPAGGLAGAASHPNLADIGRERFLLTWTQGTVESSQLRAQPLAGWGDAIGPALDVSPADRSVIGTPSAAFDSDGAGVVTYFASTGDHIDVMATRVDCSQSGSIAAAAQARRNRPVQG